MIWQFIMNVDLHCHTTASDGSLSPPELLQLAEQRNISMLSITDHDTLDAYSQIDQLDLPLRLIPGIELSSKWRKIGVHIVGLNIDLQHPTIIAGAALQTKTRRDRAEKIAEKLAGMGFKNTLDAARARALGGQIGRPHFAEHLVAIGAVKSSQQAFKKYLGAGKIADIKACWEDIETVTGWIKAAGGTAVLAHPSKYGLTRAKLTALIGDFKDAGGEAMEVISGQQTPALTVDLASLSVKHQLLASCGSDFHRHHTPWAALGRVAELPDNCIKIWSRW